MIRVFARKTKWTPIDNLAFYDEPPLFRLPNLPVSVSVTFTWDIDRGRQLFDAWRRRFENVRLGGPALDDRGGEFVTNRFIKNGITITSRGCPKKCPWCFVPKREGSLRELQKIQPGSVIQDNNILACSRSHLERVFDMLAKQKEAANFQGGLDIDYLTDWHVEQFGKLRIAHLWVACDTKAAIKRLDKARDLLAEFPINKKRCYVMIGYNGESLADAERRLKTVYSYGFLPFSQLFRSETVCYEQYSKEWRALNRKWSRPAMYRSRPGRKDSGNENM